MFSMFGGGGTEARRLPGASQFPWRGIVLAAIILIALAGIGYGVTSRASESTTAPESDQSLVPVSAVQSVRQVPVVVAPVVTPLTLRWEEYNLESNRIVYYAWGKDENGVIYGPERYDGAIKYGEFIGTGRTKDAIVYTRPSSQDRIVESVYSPSPDDTRPQGAHKPGDIIKSTLPGYEFSPDQINWFRAENYPDVPGLANIQGAVWDGKDILILANYQYEPWKYKVYAARVTPEDTKRASQ